MGKTFAAISKELDIPQKNVVRWCREALQGKGEKHRRNVKGEESEEEEEIDMSAWLSLELTKK